MLCSILSNFRIYGVRIEDPPAVLHCTVREGSGSEQAAMLISKIWTGASECVLAPGDRNAGTQHGTWELHKVPN
jgi:hypothetical protein